MKRLAFATKPPPSLHRMGTVQGAKILVCTILNKLTKSRFVFDACPKKEQSV